MLSLSLRASDDPRGDQITDVVLVASRPGRAALARNQFRATLASTGSAISASKTAASNLFISTSQSPRTPILSGCQLVRPVQTPLDHDALERVGHGFFLVQDDLPHDYDKHVDRWGIRGVRDNLIKLVVNQLRGQQQCCDSLDVCGIS